MKFEPILLKLRQHEQSKNGPRDNNDARNVKIGEVFANRKCHAEMINYLEILFLDTKLYLPTSVTFSFIR